MKIKVIITGIYLLIVCETLLARSPSLDFSQVENKQFFSVPKVKSEFNIDGRLDEDFWQEAVKIDANIEVRPGENIEAPVKTLAHVAYNDDHILVGIQCFDENPEKIRAHLCDRDNIWSDDWILILFDTFNDQRRTYDFFCNPLGIQGDEIETPWGGGGSWDAIWHSAGQITDDGYVVEMAIPFNSINFPKINGEQVWGFDVVRSLPRNVRHHIGSFPRDRNNNCYMCQSHKLVGFEGAKPGRNIEFSPTLSAVYSQERENETSGPFKESENQLDPGITAKWGITPNMILNGTINPDFSNVEADVLQLDIDNQFTLYYPEKRPFFLEGADYFRTPLQIVHTRSFSDPDWGAKITGKEGKHTLGFFSVQDDYTNYIFPGAEGSDDLSTQKQSWGSVLRYKYDIGKKSHIGGLITGREGDQYHNRVGSIDGHFKFTQTDQVMFQVAASNSAYSNVISEEYDQKKGDFGGYSFQGYYDHNTKHYNLYGFYREISPEFRADLGFMTRVGTKYSEIGATKKWQRDPGSWFTWLSIYGSYDLRRDWNENILHRAYTARLNYNGPLQSSAGSYVEFGRDLYNGNYYRARYVNSWLYMRPNGWSQIGIETRFGDGIDYDNDRQAEYTRISPSCTIKMGLHLSVEYQYTNALKNVDAGRLYTANMHYIKVMYQFSSRMFARVVLQHRDYEQNVTLYEDDDVEARSKGLFTQFLLSYKINPQTVFFLGYSDNYGNIEDKLDLIQTNRTLFAKLGYAYSL